jgi:hypothetical protein
MMAWNVPDWAPHKETHMPIHAVKMSPRVPIGEPEEPDESPMPVDPDEGPVPAQIPDDPEHDRVIDPED